MARTADFKDFDTGVSSSILSGGSVVRFFKNLWKSFVFASELRALNRVELECGHRIDEKTLRQLKRELFARHGYHRSY